MPVEKSPERHMLAAVVDRLTATIGDEADVREYTNTDPTAFDLENLPTGGMLVLVALSQMSPQAPDALAGDGVWQEATWEVALQLVVREREGLATCVDLAAACRQHLVGWRPPQWGPFIAGALQVQSPDGSDLWAYLQRFTIARPLMHGPSPDELGILDAFTLGPLGGPMTEHTTDG